MADLFAVIHYTPYIFPDACQIVITTDVYCHLWLRYSFQKPQKHLEPVVRRGLLKQDDPYYCLVAGHDNEQQEPGDTYVHTFYKPDWPFCETRWFYFWGEIAGTLSPSASGIFSLHNNGEFTPLDTGWLIQSDLNRTLLRSLGRWSTTHDSATGTITTWHEPPTSYMLAGAGLTASYWIYRAFLRYDTSSVPAGATIVSAVLSFHCIQKWLTSSLGRPYLQVTQGVQSTPIVPANYGDQLPYTTVGGQIDIGDIIEAARNEIEFNADGLAMINRGGTTRLCLRGQQDVDDINPPLGFNRVLFHSRSAPLHLRTWLKVFYYP